MARSSSFLRREARDAAPRRRARALTAAGTKIDPTNAAQVKRATANPRDWQLRALHYYDELGEVRYGARWMGDAISRLRVIPAYQESPSDVPVELEVAERPDSELAAADGAIARLAMGAESGLSGIMRGLSLNVWLTGESYLVGYEDPEGGGEEVWDVASVEALVPGSSGTGMALRASPGNALSEGTIDLPEGNSFVLQVLRRHPRWRDWPDAAMRGALEYCEDLVVLTRMIRATATSRIPAGAFLVPEEASFGATPTATLAEGEEEQDPLTRDLIRHMTTPVSTPGDAAAIVPFIMRMSRDDIAAARLLNFERPIDTLAVELRDEARRALATVLDLPAEVLSGKGDLNHWTAWQVDDEAFRIHVEPLATLILDALTTEYYQPSLDALGIEDPGHHRLWYDASALVSNRDEGDVAFRLYDRGELRGDALRGALGVSEDEAPDDDELARRKELAKIIAPRRGASEPGEGMPAGAADADEGPPALVADGIPLAEVISPPELAPGPVPLGVIADAAKLDLPDPADVAPDPGESPAHASLDPLAEALVSIERELRLRIQSAADELARRALERAGNRLRSLANRDRSGLAARSLTSVPAAEVGATLGPGLVAAIGTSAVELADGALAPLHARFTRWVVAAFDSIVALTEPWATPGFDYSPFRARLADGIEAGWAQLSADVEALVAERIITPHPAPPEAGEYDDTVLVPPGLVRAALLTVGDGPLVPVLTAAVPTVTGPAVPGPRAAEAVGGLITSDMLYGMLARSAGLILGGGGWRWVYGSALSRVTPFAPHLRLEGTTFTDWDDPKLAYAGWPGPFLHPGDHAYCQCDVVPLLAREVEPPPEPELDPYPNFGLAANPAQAFATWVYDSGQLGQGLKRDLKDMEAWAKHALGPGGFDTDDLNELAATMTNLHRRYDPDLIGKHSPDPMFADIKGRRPRVFPDPKAGRTYAYYSDAGGSIGLTRALTKAALQRDRQARWHPLDSLASVYAHEYGHWAQSRYIGRWTDDATVDRWRRAVLNVADSDAGRELARRVGAPVIAPGRGSADHVVSSWLNEFLSGYAGPTRAGSPYSTVAQHHASEGFAELFSIFGTPGGCAELTRGYTTESTSLSFAKLLRQAINDDAGWDLIPDCH